MNHPKIRKIRVAFNGFGRIGRHVFRFLWGHPLVEITGIWAPLVKENERALNLAYDPYYGPWEGHHVERKKNAFALIVDGRDVPVNLNASLDGADNVFYRQREWDVLIECSGTLKKDSTGHGERFRDYVDNGRKVIFTYPTEIDDITLVMGVNHGMYEQKHRLISNASCTTNCAAPIIKSLLDAGISLKECSGITVHAATRSQKALTILDQILDYTTGAANVLDRIIPQLQGKMHITAVRVPTAEVSYLQLACVFERTIGVSDIRAVLRTAAEGSMKDIIGLSPVELSKTDTSGFYKKNPHSAIVSLRGISGSEKGTVRVIPAWYDNEYAYSCRVRDLLLYIAEREGWIRPASHEHDDEYIPRPEYQSERLQ